MRAKVELFVDLDAVAADAAGALDHDAQAALYDTIDWFRLTREHVLKDAPLIVARARCGDASAWIFLVRQGAKASALASWYTLRYAPVFSGTADRQTRVDLLAAIARLLKRRLARLTLQPVDGAGLDLLTAGFRRGGWLTGSAYQTANWVAHTQGEDFAGYWARRPGQLRNTTRRKALKADLTIRIAERFEDAAWRDFEAVFDASWKGEEGSPTFLRALAERVGTWGRLRMALAYNAAGAPLAAQLWTLDGDVATIHKLAYVDSARALSPGTVLSQAMFAHVIDGDRPAIVDFGTGDDPYKADWMDEKRLLYRFDAYSPWKLSGLGGYARARVAALVARLRKP